jgi:hypothetical protein
MSHGRDPRGEDRAAGSGLVRSALGFIASVPDRLALVVLAATVTVTAMLQLRIFDPLAAIGVTVVLVAATWRLAPSMPRPDRRSVLGVVVALEVVAAWIWVNAPYYEQELSVYRDPSIYALRGWWLTRHASPVIDMSAAIRGANSVPGAAVASGGFPVHGHVAYPQAASLVPGLLGVAGRVGGLRVMLAANLVIGGTALLLVYGVARRLMGPIWALVPLVALALSMPMVYFARASYSEPTALAAVFAGLLILWWAFDTRRMSLFVLAGLCVGVSALARVDGVLTVVAAMLGIGVAASAATRPDNRRQLRWAFVAFAAGGLVSSLAGWYDLARNSPSYYSSQASDLHALFALYAVVFVVLFALSYLPLHPVRAALVTHRFGLARVAAVFVLVVCAVMASRPLWWTGRFITEPAIQAAVGQRQRAAGLAVDPQRSYDEQTVNWLAWYLGWPVVILASAGLALLLWHAVGRRDLRALVFFAVFGVVAALYLNDVNITPDQIWASRRMLPVVIPGLVIAAGYLVATLAAKANLRWLAVPVGVLIAIGPALQWRYVFMQAEFGGELAAVNSACAAIDRGQAGGAHRYAVVAGSTPPTGFWSPTLQIVCDATVVSLPRPTAAALRQVRANWGGAPVTVITFAAGSVPWKTAVPGPRFDGPVVLWNQSLVARPTGTSTIRTAFWAGTVDTDGAVSPISP